MDQPEPSEGYEILLCGGELLVFSSYLTMVGQAISAEYRVFNKRPSISERDPRALLGFKVQVRRIQKVSACYLKAKMFSYRVE